MKFLVRCLLASVYYPVVWLYLAIDWLLVNDKDDCPGLLIILLFIPVAISLAIYQAVLWLVQWSDFHPRT